MKDYGHVKENKNASEIYKNYRKSMDLRIIGPEAELKEFIGLCKIIQRLGKTGSSRTIKLRVDGDGSGRLSFYGIEGGSEEGKILTPCNSEGIDDEEMLKVSIGE